jgi:hypothetical protein
MMIFLTEQEINGIFSNAFTKKKSHNRLCICLRLFDRSKKYARSTITNPGKFD